MEWTDTLMLERFSAAASNKSSEVQESTRVIPLPGITLLCATTSSRDEMSAALELLRGFRATGRRVVLCDTSELVVGKQFGSEVVETGGVSLLVSCGISGREVGIGARDAGLDLASVVVCSQPLAAGQVLRKQLIAGDTVLMLGIDHSTCMRLAGMLEEHLVPQTVIAA